MYRILLASSGNYYVQQYTPHRGWLKTGGFFPSKGVARRYVRLLEQGYLPSAVNRVVEYIY